MRVWVEHFEIPARRLERAAEFYRAALGWQVERLEWQGPDYLKVRSGPAGGDAPGSSRGLRGGLMRAVDAGFEEPLLVLHVADATLAECLQRIIAAGGKLEQGPTAIGDLGSFARFRDTEGNLLGLWQGREATKGG
jgi:predicted enzyme related to lactoylglutathione lyase